jgi:hypothetical protein
MATVKRKAKGFTWRGLRFEVTSELMGTEWTSGDGVSWNWKVRRYTSGEYMARLRVVGCMRFGSDIHRSKTDALESALARAQRDSDELRGALLVFEP